MKKILRHFQQNLILSLTIIGCLGIYPANLIQSPATFSESSPGDLQTNSDSDKGQDLTNSQTSPNTPTKDPNASENEDPNDPNKDPTDPANPTDPPGSTTPIDPTSPKDPDESDEPYDFNSDLIIYALNPGYSKTTTTGKLSNVGEFIELLNLTDAPLALAGYSLTYTNTKGKSLPIFTFPEGSVMTGKRLLLRYSKSPESEQSDLVYKNSLALKAGPLQLTYDEEIVDQVCWNGKTDCEPAFSSSNPETIKRDLLAGTFERLPAEEYEPEFSSEELRFFLPPEPEEPEDSEEDAKLPPHCQGLEFSELLTYYVDDKSEQFIELFNPTATDIILDGCKISYKNKSYELSGTINSGAYLAYYQSDQFALTKNPKNPLTLTLLDVDDSVLDEIAYPNGQKKSTSYARIYDETGNETWEITYSPTPNAENIYQKFRTCEAGKIINEATGNCVKITPLKTTASSFKSSSTLAPCPAGKYRNPLTGRCKKIETTSTTLKECAEGYERNPETNRCRKVTKPNDGADFPVVPTTHSDQTVFIGFGVVILIVGLGLTYVILQFRHEISRATRKAGQRLNHIRQDLFSRSRGRDRDQKP